MVEIRETRNKVWFVQLILWCVQTILKLFQGYRNPFRMVRNWPRVRIRNNDKKFSDHIFSNKVKNSNLSNHFDVVSIAIEPSTDSRSKAEQHKNLLLEYDRTSEQRTKVIDDESDYFSMNSNQWLTPQQRKALEKRSEEINQKRHGSRLDKKYTFDFAGNVQFCFFVKQFIQNSKMGHKNLQKQIITYF